MSEEQKKKAKMDDMESELYSIVNTIHTLYKKYQSGNLNHNFFQKSIKSCMNDLLKINFELKEQNIDISEFLDYMDFNEQYYGAIDIINSVSDLNFSRIHGEESDLLSKGISASILELPGVTSQITSSFITLLDALRLNALDNKNITSQLFKDIKDNLEKFPGLELIRFNLENIYKNVLNNYSKFIKNKKFRDSIEDDLYKLYQDFQKKLNLRD
ncbi:MAG: hypothetical protein ACFFFB_04955 [Candidatus Heimdallarchaeota archaeon]